MDAIRDDITKQTAIVRRYRRKLHDAEKKLHRLIDEYQSVCEHRWVPDRTQCDPCRTMHVCEKCGKDR